MCYWMPTRREHKHTYIHTYTLHARTPLNAFIHCFRPAQRERAKPRTLTRRSEHANRVWYTNGGLLQLSAAATASRAQHMRISLPAGTDFNKCNCRPFSVVSLASYVRLSSLNAPSIASHRRRCDDKHIGRFDARVLTRYRSLLQPLTTTSSFDRSRVADDDDGRTMRNEIRSPVTAFRSENDPRASERACGVYKQCD